MRRSQSARGSIHNEAINSKEVNPELQLIVSQAEEAKDDPIQKNSNEQRSILSGLMANNLQQHENHKESRNREEQNKMQDHHPEPRPRT